MAHLTISQLLDSGFRVCEGSGSTIQSVLARVEDSWLSLHGFRERIYVVLRLGLRRVMEIWLLSILRSGYWDTTLNPKFETGFRMLDRIVKTTARQKLASTKHTPSPNFRVPLPKTLHDPIEAYIIPV